MVRYVTLLLPYNGVKPDIRVKLLNESADRPLSNVNLEITEYGQKKWIGYTL